MLLVRDIGIGKIDTWKEKNKKLGRPYQSIQLKSTNNLTPIPSSTIGSLAHGVLRFALGNYDQLLF